MRVVGNLVGSVCLNNARLKAVCHSPVVSHDRFARCCGMLLGCCIRRETLALVCSALILLGTGCGGGTTGTSPTDTLKFSGFAEAADGTRAPQLTMTVRSATTDELLADSGTDQNGDFLMVLPSSEESLEVDVSGFNSTTVARMQRGGGTLTAKLAVAPEGFMRAEQVSEAQIESSSLCSSLTISGSGLVITGPLPQEPCGVTVLVASQQLNLTTFSGTLRANCKGSPTVLQTAAVDAVGRVEFDLTPAFGTECSDLKIEVSSSQATGLQHVFVID